jgi:formylglycine-generating enzyme required for sulfatase activity
LIQEYFAARALSGRLEQTPARTLWPPERWWARNNREVAVVLMAGFDPKGCSRVAKWLADAQPEVAAQCIDENGIETVSPELLKGLQTAWAQRLAGAGRDPQPEARAGVGRALGLLNLDRRPGVGLRPDGLPDIDLVQISGGRFLYGEKMQPRNVETFWMSRYPVTNAQYTAFLKAEDGYRIDDWWAGLDADEKDRIPAPPEWSEANCPRETVNWFEAMAFCAWLSHRLTRAQGRKVEIRLPTEWEWERAARGTKGRAFPWGEKYADGPANIHADSHRLGRTSSVGIYPDGAAREPGDPGGRIHDLAGNVWEWCLNRWEPEDNIDPAGRESRVVRGGAWHYNQDYARAVYRNLFNPSNRYDFVGFRVVSSSPIYR